jgi:hypothetical protein
VGLGGRSSTCCKVGRREVSRQSDGEVRLRDPRPEKKKKKKTVGLADPQPEKKKTKTNRGSPARPSEIRRGETHEIRRGETPARPSTSFFLLLSLFFLL